jgi:hypothetical protein
MSYAVERAIFAEARTLVEGENAKTPLLRARLLQPDLIGASLFNCVTYNRFTIIRKKFCHK